MKSLNSKWLLHGKKFKFTKRTEFTVARKKSFLVKITSCNYDLEKVQENARGTNAIILIPFTTLAKQQVFKKKRSRSCPACLFYINEL